MAWLLQALMDERILQPAVAVISIRAQRANSYRYFRGYLYPQNHTIVIYRIRPLAFGILFLYALVRRDPVERSRNRPEVPLDCDCCGPDVSIDV